MRRKIFYIFIFTFLPALHNIKAQSVTDSINANYIIKVSLEQYRSMAEILPDSLHYPRTVDADGSIKLVTAGDWTSGFFPGSLWYLYEQTGDPEFFKAAVKWTASISSQRYNTGTHDLGFMFNCSFGNGYRLMHDTAYRTVMLDAARSLATRFNPVVGCIRSWDFGNWSFPVIIDNMMNLELLFRATRETGDSSFYNIAVSHANTTMKNHYRVDYSSWHVVDYDPETGNVISKTTAQGASDSSDWARGQAWGLYGFVMCYRETGDTSYLHFAEHIAHFILSWPGMPADMIPYWDYLATNIPDEPRDASAAAITASALIELSGYSLQDSAYYIRTAARILRSLSSNVYMADPGTNHYFILKHSTGNKPANREVDVPENWADYYFLEAVKRFRQRVNTNNPPEVMMNLPGTLYGGDTTMVVVTALDLDKGDSVALSISGQPEFVTFRSTGKDSALLGIYTTANDTGHYSFTIIATDKKENRTGKNVHLQVRDPLLKNIKVSASSWQDPNIPENTLDNDTATRWSAEGNGQYITYDLGEMVDLTAVRIAFYLGDQRQAYFQVQVSEDGTQYHIVLYGTGSGTTTGFQTFTLPDTVTTRYVRIVGFGNSQNDWNSLTEVDFDIFRLSTGILPATNKGNVAIHCYPNPVTHMLNVIVHPVRSSGPVQIRLCDSSGRQYFMKDLSEKKSFNPVQIDMSGFLKGAYLLAVRQGKTKTSVRIILK